MRESLLDFPVQEPDYRIISITGVFDAAEWQA
jgi:hypothetical protein